MKTKFNVILALLAVFLVQITFAQEKEISGTVKDEDDMPLPGVNITVEGTDNGTQTDFDGEYSIDAEVGQTLRFSYVGMQDQEIDVGQSNTIDVTMTEGSELDEVVVTALGISREKKSLGYATQEVSGEDVSKINSGNFTNALSGKVSGLDITRNNNFGGSTNVVLRGKSSITGDNQALFVVDGVPMNNQNVNTADQKNGRANSYDYGNAINDLDPDDIESVNTLKGAAATALYGSRAANGAIEITTKKGEKTEGLGVTLNSKIQIGQMDSKTFPTFQNQYGGGYGGEEFTEVTVDGETGTANNFIDDASYGPKYDADKDVYHWDSFDPDLDTYGEKSPYTAPKHGPKDFFETPITLTNSVSVSNGYDKGNYRMSYTNQDNHGALPNAKSMKHNFKFSGQYDLSDWVTVSGNATYINDDTKGRNSTGYSDNQVNLFREWWGGADLKKLKNAYFKTGRNVSWNPENEEPGAAPLYWDNPYWARYENYENDTRDRFIGQFQVDMDITDWFSVTGRIATDTYTERQENRRAVGSVPELFGVTRSNAESGYQRRQLKVSETNYDLHLNFDTDLSEDLSFTGLLGGNIRRNSFNDYLQSTLGGLLNPGVYSLQNSVEDNPKPDEAEERTGVDAIFADASFGYKDLLYLEGTIRRDHFSTLPDVGSESVVWYPSISGTFLFSELLDSDVISYGKFRANYAEVGNGTDFDRLRDTYVINNDIGASLPTQHNNPDLKPERTKEFEVGLDMDFMNDRFGFDFAFYNRNTEDQIMPLSISPATGYTSKIINAGKVRNRGFEVGLNLTPVKTEDWNWELDANFSKNKNEVVSLPEGINTIQLGSYQGGITVQAREGEANGVLNGSDYTYDDDGNRIVDSDGHYTGTKTSQNHDIGDTNPDWLMGINNSISWKNLSMSFLIDIQHGGNVFSLDQYYGESSGLYPNTAGLNDKGNPLRNTLDEGGGFINPGVNEDGEKNDIRVDASEQGEFGYAAYPDSEFVYDAGYVKLRELSITYDLPDEVLKNSFIEGVQFSLTGENLWIIHKNVPFADPEAGISSGNSQGVLIGAMPTFRQYGFNVKVQL